MKKRILCSSLIALGAMFTVLGLSVNAVEAPEEIIPVVTTTLTETTTNTSKATNAVSTASRRMVTTRAATIVTEVPTIVEDNVSDEVSEVSEVYEEAPETEVPCEPEPIITEPYIVYKPSTKYVHRNSCRWNSGDTIIITNTNDIESRKCTECNPDIEIVNEYIEPEPIIEDCDLTEEEIILLRKIVSYEYGSDWVPVYEKAKVVNGVMNRVYDSRFPNTIYDVLTQSGQFPGFYTYGTYYMSDSIIASVDYYFAHTDEFDNSNSWYADGCGYNVFYYQ